MEFVLPEHVYSSDSFIFYVINMRVPVPSFRKTYPQVFVISYFCDWNIIHVNTWVVLCDAFTLYKKRFYFVGIKCD